MGRKSIQDKGYYWCNKCGRLHRKGRGKLFKAHIKEARDVSDQELRMLQFKRHWNECAKEAAKYGAVNLPKKEKKRSQKFTKR